MSQIYIQRKLNFQMSQRWCVSITLNQLHLSALLPLQVFILNNKNTTNVMSPRLHIWTQNCATLERDSKGKALWRLSPGNQFKWHSDSGISTTKQPWINNAAKEECASWTPLLSTACKIRHVFKPLISLPLQTPIQKANKTQLLKPKEIKRTGLGWSQLCPPVAVSTQLLLQTLQSHHSWN